MKKLYITLLLFGLTPLINATPQNKPKEYHLFTAIEKTVRTSYMAIETVFSAHEALQHSKKLIKNNKNKWLRVANLLEFSISVAKSYYKGEKAIKNGWKAGCYIYNLVQEKKQKKTDR